MAAFSFNSVASLPFASLFLISSIFKEENKDVILLFIFYNIVNTQYLNNNFKSEYY